MTTDLKLIQEYNQEYDQYDQDIDYLEKKLLTLIASSVEYKRVERQLSLLKESRDVTLKTKNK